MTHPTWFLPLDSEAGLILTPCPGTKGVDLVDSLSQLRKQGAIAVITGLTFDELKQLGVTDFGSQVEMQSMQWFHFPIDDDGIPDDEFELAFKQNRTQLLSVLNQDAKVVIHCAGGSGRTGLIAARLLLALGWQWPQIKQQVQALRPGAFTKENQLSYIESFT
ncbi:tyrosine-protein phosphatase [Paraferrimonas sp. SM1919]|uniref:phosphatase domain-containing protein n=1 Tax=Paraferrimonas sp. SM1919 TaxID=2662263 RepID=UPI0013D3029B|nr:tyrosine-protein phosphatase [Paraferrimonas sp. SM1919]